MQSSSYAKLAGIPVAAHGPDRLRRDPRGDAPARRAPAARGELAGRRGPLFSLYLTYLELFEIDAICQWCVGSAVIMAVLAVLTTLRAIASPVNG